jgi:hypothetical protein
MIGLPLKTSYIVLVGELCWPWINSKNLLQIVQKFDNKHLNYCVGLLKFYKKVVHPFWTWLQCSHDVYLKELEL